MTVSTSGPDSGPDARREGGLADRPPATLSTVVNAWEARPREETLGAMTMSEIATQLRAVFVEALDLGADVDVENLKYRDLEAWDSVGHMALIAAIEDEFDVEFDTDQVIDMSSFKVAVDMVTELKAKND